MEATAAEGAGSAERFLLRAGLKSALGLRETELRDAPSDVAGKISGWGLKNNKKKDPKTQTNPTQTRPPLEDESRPRGSQHFPAPQHPGVGPPSPNSPVLGGFLFTLIQSKVCAALALGHGSGGPGGSCCSCREGERPP